MRLAEFITSNTEGILAEFEAFARDIVPEDSLDIAALRDHAAAILEVVARDLQTPQSIRQTAEKALGHSDAIEGAPDTPAQEHGSGRAMSGFTVVEMVSEYRALRASVIRLWTAQAGELKAADLNDLVRFNEAIDQALAESTQRFMYELDRTRDTFLGILGHDLRSPLSAATTSAQFMLQEIPLPPSGRELAEAIVSSTGRMNEMVRDLLDFTRSRLGVAMPISASQLDLGEVLEEAIAEMKAARPGSRITLETSGDLHGQWDEARLRQVLSNLLSNALNHGAEQGPIAVSANADGDRVVFTVHNDGPAIPPDKIGRIFEPLSRHATASRDAQHLGLGLYIACQVVTGHGGTIDVDSSRQRGTTFTVSLPRQPKAHKPAGQMN